MSAIHGRAAYGSGIASGSDTSFGAGGVREAVPQARSTPDGTVITFPCSCLADRPTAEAVRWAIGSAKPSDPCGLRDAGGPVRLPRAGDLSADSDWPERIAPVRGYSRGSPGVLTGYSPLLERPERIASACGGASPARCRPDSSAGGSTRDSSAAGPPCNGARTPNGSRAPLLVLARGCEWALLSSADRRRNAGRVSPSAQADGPADAGKSVRC